MNVRQKSGDFSFRAIFLRLIVWFQKSLPVYGFLFGFLSFYFVMCFIWCNGRHLNVIIVSSTPVYKLEGLCAWAMRKQCFLILGMSTCRAVADVTSEIRGVVFVVGFAQMIAICCYRDTPQTKKTKKTGDGNGNFCSEIKVNNNDGW